MTARRVEGATFPLARGDARLLYGVLGLGIATAIFFLTYTNGGFSSTTRAYAAIALWWLLGLAAAAGIGAVLGVGRLAFAAAALLALFAVWTLISIRWAPDAERAFAQFDQVSLYLAVLVAGIVLGRLVPASVLVGATALALTAVAVVALVSRLFPSTFGQQAGATILAPLFQRLSFPLGYWNGLGIDVALAYPLLLATMAARRSRVTSALAALPLAVLGAVMYLTSSRGAFVAAGVAVTVFLLLAPHRWAAFAAALVAAGAGAASIATLSPRRALVEGKMDTALGVHQGHHAALVIGVTSVVAAVAWLGLAELGRRMPSPPRVVGWATATLLVGVAIAGIVASHPVARFDTFRSSSVAYGGGSETLLNQHLLSSSGTGRWQLWSAAVSEFRAHPLKGGGAGSWRSWWLQHESIPLFTQYAHSLYLEALAELGIVGLLLIGTAAVVAVVGAARAALKLRSGEIAGAAACGTAFVVAAAYDWVWQLAGIAVVGVGMLGVALGAFPSNRARTPSRFGIAPRLLALVAVAAIVPQIMILAAGIHLRNSYAAALNGNAGRAVSEALAAKAVEPWSASAYLQLAEISKAQGRYGAARRWLDKAISRSNDYGLWIAAAQIDTLRGRILLARRDLAELHRLYPRSRYVQGGS